MTKTTREKGCKKASKIFFKQITRWTKVNDNPGVKVEEKINN